MEYAQAHAAPPGLASLTLGYTQEYYINLLRHASSENIFLISFWVVAINVLLLALWRHRENLLWLSLLSVLLLVLLVLPFVFTKMVSRDSNLFHEKLLEVHRVLLPREAPGVTGTSAASAGTFCRFKFISMGL